MPGCITRFDSALARDIEELVGDLPDSFAAAIRTAIDEAKRASVRRYDAISNGRRPTDFVGPPVGGQHAGAHLLPEFGADDADHPVAAAGPRLQHALTTIMDQVLSSELITEARVQGRPHDAIRLRDLADQFVNHEYL